MRVGWVAMLGSALLLVACGGGGVVKPNDPALERGLLAPDEMGGMVPVHSTPIHGAAGWAAHEQVPGSTVSAETARLRRIGFIAGVSEQMSSPSSSTREGVTLVEQFKSAKGPEAEIANTTGTNGPWTLFHVQGIPGARGFEQEGGGQGGRNIAFGHGDFFYLIGSGWQGRASNGVSRAEMIAVAQRLYRRVAG